MRLPKTRKHRGRRRRRHDRSPELISIRGRRSMLEQLESRCLLSATPVGADWHVELPYDSGETMIHDTAVDGAGNVIVLGEYNGTVDFDPGAGTHELTSSPTADLFVAKYDRQGDFIDAIDVGDFDVGFDPKLTVDGANAIYVTTPYEGAVSLLGGVTVPPQQDPDESLLIFKLDAGLQSIEWAAHATLSAWAGYSRGEVRAHYIAVDPAGNSLYLAGRMVGRGTVGNIDVQADFEGFVMQIDSASGTFRWIRFTEPNIDGIAVDPTASDSVYVVETHNFLNKPSEDYLLRFSAEGDVALQTRFGRNVSWSLDVYAGGVYLAGTFSGVAEIGQSSFASHGLSDVLIARLDATGTVVWTTQAGGEHSDAVGSFSADEAGNLFIAGSLTGQVTFGADTLVPSTTADVYLTQLEASDGSFLQSWRYGRANIASIAGAAGSLYVGGLFRASSIDFPTGEDPVATSDVHNYLMRFSPASDPAIPRINGVVAEPNPVPQGNPVTFSVAGMHDPDNRVESVTFYEDVDGDRRLNPSVDSLVAVDQNGSDGWSVAADSSLLPLGVNTFLAQAVYDGSFVSLAVSAKAKVEPPIDDNAVTYSSSEVPLAIRDLKTITSSIIVQDTIAIADVNVQLDITHTRVDDLDVFLIGPDGTRVELFTDVGDYGVDNFTNTTLDDEAVGDDGLPLNIVNASAPFTGSYQPEGILNGAGLHLFDGGNSLGEWVLEIYDDTKGTFLSSVGELNAWSLTITPGAPPAPTLSIDDASVVEGDGGTTVANFTVTRAGDLSGTVSVDYATTDGTATAGSDYTAIGTTTLTFDPGVETLPVAVAVNGDTDEEGDETFFVNLGNAVGATIADAQGVGTILDDDAQTGSNTIFVWDIQDALETRQRGRKFTDYRLVIDVRQDTDGDGVAEASDAGMEGVTVTVVLTDSSGQSRTLTGQTDSAGIFRSDWIKDLEPDTYRAEVTDLALAGFQWDPFGLLDPTSNDEDSDGDGLPDETFVVA